MKYEDYYNILGVDSGAGAAAIKKAYRNLARKYHPDVTRDPSGEEKFKKVAEAYQTLKDPAKRAAYDRLGQRAQHGDVGATPESGRQFSGAGFTFNGFDLSDLFATFSGNERFSGNRAHAAQPGRDYEVSANISLEDAFHGTTLTLKLSLPGSGPDGNVRSVPRSFKVQVPKGTTDGQTLRLSGQGGRGINGGSNGDLYVKITLRPHPLFQVKERDVYLDLPLTPWEAMLGGAIEVPTPSGTVKLKIPPGTSAGQKLRIAQRGLPGAGARHGDLFAIVHIVVPAVISEKERDLLKELAAGSTFDPRSHFHQEFA